MNVASNPAGAAVPRWNPANAPPSAGPSAPTGATSVGAPDSLALSTAAGGGPAAPTPAPAPAQHVGILATVGALFSSLWHGFLRLFGLESKPAATPPAPSAPPAAPAPPPPPTLAPAPAGGTGAAAAAPPAPAPTCTVVPGDSLWKIAADHLGDGNRWPEIFARNRDQISNPNLIYPGQVLKLPGGAETARSEAAPAPRPGNAAEPWSPGPGQLQGADTSGWQSDAEFEASIQGKQWTVIKASQGTGFVDKTFQRRWDELGRKVADGSMTLRMAYVFLNQGDGAGQARHFLDTVGIHGPLPAGTRLALDWEADALGDPQTLKDAADTVHQVTGTWPVIYVQGSKVDVARATVPEAPIWEAAWSSHNPGNVPFWQYSDGPGYDHDVFNGDEAALKRFAGQG